MKGWTPHTDLSRLLEGLGEEIVAAADEELCQLSGQTGYPIAGAAHEVRRLIAGVTDRPDEPDENIGFAAPMDHREPCLKSH